MINLLRADFYKLFHTRVLYVCTFVLLCYVGIVAAAFYSLDHMPQEKKEMLQAGNQAGEGVSLTVDDETDISEQFLQSGTQLAGGVIEEIGVIVMIIGIMIAILVGGEFKERTIKSMVAKGYKREHIVITKVIVSAIATIIMVTCAALVAFIVGSVLSGNVNSYDNSELLAKARCILGGLAIFVSFSSLYTLIVIAIRNVEISVVINIVIIMMLPNILGVIERTWKIPFSKIQLTEGFNKVIQSNASIVNMAHIGILFVGYVIISTIIACLVFKRADVK